MGPGTQTKTLICMLEEQRDNKYWKQSGSGSSIYLLYSQYIKYAQDANKPIPVYRSEKEVSKKAQHKEVFPHKIMHILRYPRRNKRHQVVSCFAYGLRNQPAVQHICA